jgi:FKBP-type peptidyl-prolyl cis-trans isomerase FkpA
VIRRAARALVLVPALALPLAACDASAPPAETGAAAPAAESGDAGAATETTDSGLRMTILAPGDGPSPAASDVVRVHYHGTFEDGSVFDSSVERGQPAVFPLNRVIPCWTEALQRMKVGGKARLVCPPQIAYGKRGAPPTIPPDATLVFEVELLGIR